jgi:hypothetical protein
MDPVTLSAAAVALLSTSFGAGFAKEAGKNAWESAKNVAGAVASRLSSHDHGRRVLAELEANPDDPVKRTAVVDCLRSDIDADNEFAVYLSRLMTAVQSSEGGRTLIAHATGEAKQVNVAGNNFGPINFLGGASEQTVG